MNARNSLLLVLALLLTASPAFATQQIWDRLRFEGRTYAIPQVPLNALWMTEDGRLELPGFDVMSSANWKGYIAEWEVFDSRLYLTKFKARRDGRRVPISEFVNGVEGKGRPVLAKWFSGRIHVPFGDYRGTHALTSIIVFHIAKGRVTKAEILFNRPLVQTWNGLPAPKAPAKSE